MDEALRNLLCPLLQDRRTTLVATWSQAFAHHNDTHVATLLDSQHLGPLLDQIIECLLAEPFYHRTAEQIGARLARLCAGDPQVLGQTQVVLLQGLIYGLPEAAIPIFQSRLITCIGSISTGFAQRARDALIGEYRSIQEILLAAQGGVIAVVQDQDVQLRTLMRNLPVVLVRLDKTGMIELALGRGFTRLGIHPQTLVGQSIFRVTNIVPDLLEYIQAALAGDAFAAVVEIRGRLFETRYRPLRTPKGVFEGTLGIGLDITHQTHLEADLRLARSQIAQNRDTYHNQMMQTISTAIGEPLADIQVAMNQLPPDAIDTYSDIATVRQQISQVMDNVQMLTEGRTSQPAHPSAKPRTNDSISGLDLTDAEQQLVQQLVAGQSNQEIAEALFISRKGVEKRLSKLYAKLGVRRRTEVIALALQVDKRHRQR